MDRKELKELMDIAKEKRLMIFEAMSTHFLPAYISMKKDLNKIGNLKIEKRNFEFYKY